LNCLKAKYSINTFRKMGSSLTCTPHDDDQTTIHAANQLYPQSTLRIVSADTLKALDDVYIPLLVTPSPSRSRTPNISMTPKNRLPKKIQVRRQLEPVISGESWDSFGEFPRRELAQMNSTQAKEEALTRCVSDRQVYLKVKSLGKRSSMPVEVLRDQLRQMHVSVAPPKYGSLPFVLTDFEGLPRCSTDRSGLETPISDIYIDLDTTRSRPGWASVRTTQGTKESFPSFRSGTFHEENRTIRRRIGEILSVENSDSQFHVPSPVLSPVFSNKVRKFADDEEERLNEVVNALDQTFQQLPHISSSTSDSGSPINGINIGGNGFPLSPSPYRSSGELSIGGAIIPRSPTPDMTNAGWRVVASLERTRLLASHIKKSPELLENMAKELEALSMKYAGLMQPNDFALKRDPTQRSGSFGVVVC